MLICKLQRLDIEAVNEIAEQDEKLRSKLHNGTEVAVLNVEAGNCDLPHLNYYNIVFADGTTCSAISGMHLKGIEHWDNYMFDTVCFLAANKSKDGCGYHVNRKLDGTFYVSDWYDSDATVRSYVNGQQR